MTTDNLKIDKNPPIVSISNLNVIAENGKEQRFIPSTNSDLKFPYNQNTISLSYIGIQFNNTDGVIYAYQLENYQKDWQQVGTDRTARFSNLPPGNYTFKVKAANADGIWSEPKSLNVIINPPWWKTWWAKLCYSLLIIGFIGLLVLQYAAKK